MSDEDFYEEFRGRGGDGDKHPGWSWQGKPEGTVFAGEIIDRFKFKDKKSDRTRMAFSVQTDNGPFTLFVSQWQLERALTERGPEVGDVLKVRYDGIDPEDGQSKRFTVKVEKGAPVPDDDSAPF